jgi:hypothetical protein
MLRLYFILFKDSYIYQKLNIENNNNILDTVNDITSPNISHIINLYVTDIFITIDRYSHLYTNGNWFLRLNILELNSFIHELYDVWRFRSNISEQIRNNICTIDPFINIIQIVNNDDINIVRIQILHIIGLIINSGIDTDSRYLGCIFVIGTLTLISHDAQYAYPWLYNAFC